MAEPDDPGQPGGDESESLDKLKAALESADSEGMDEGSPARFDIHWDPVTDAGGPSAVGTESPDEGGGFQFDLGGALARMGETVEPTAPEPPAGPGSNEPEPRHVAVEAPAPATTGDDPLSSVRGLIDGSSSLQRPDARTVARDAPPPPPAPPVAPHVEPMPEIVEATNAELPVRAKPAARGSVFADVEAEPPAPRLPGQPEARSAPASPQPQATPTAAPSLPGSAPGAFVGADAAPAAPELPADSVPVLPEAPPIASPMVTEVREDARPAADAHALRSAQLRADRQVRQSRLFGRSLLAFLAVAAFIAAGLIFGRSYLFQTEWDATLTPVVDQIQTERGADFDHTVPLSVQPAPEYADTVLAATIGSDWADDLPIWRAAGLAAGDASIASVAAELAVRFPVVYDPETDTIYQLADADAARVEAELRIVLDDVYQLQLGGVVAARSDSDETRFAGVSNPGYVAQRAVDILASGGRSPVTVADGEADEPAEPDIALPLPIRYELEAIDLLGEAVLVGANVDPSSAARGVPYPEGLAGVLDDSPTRTSSALLRPGEQGLADPLALGTDDWSLVWGAYLMPTTVDRLTDIVIADSFRPIDRNGVTCFLGVFQTASETDGSQVFASMLSWARAAPVESQAVASQLGGMRVQIEACDAKSSSTGPVEPSAVDDLITRQVDRLAR